MVTQWPGLPGMLNVKNMHIFYFVKLALSHRAQKVHYILNISGNSFQVHCVGWDNIHCCVHYRRNIYGDVGGLDPQTQVTFCMCSPIQCEWGSDRGCYRVLAPGRPQDVDSDGTGGLQVVQCQPTS